MSARPAPRALEGSWRRLGLAAPALASLSACGGELPAPVVEAVSPDRGWNGELTYIEILGSNFFPQVEMDAGRQGVADVDATFGAWIVGPDGAGERIDLRGVSAVDVETLQASVVAGLVAGTYDVFVESPSGMVAELSDGFVVSDSRADRLALEASPLIWEVQQYALVTVSLLDPLGERVFSEFPVEVSVVADEGGPVPVTFGTGGLEDSVLLPDNTTIRGDLGIDGLAQVMFLVDTPGTYTVTATPTSDEGAVDEGSLKLLFEPGSDLSLDIVLPQAPFEAVAGVPFDIQLTLEDQFGNPALDVPVTVALRNVCNTWVDLVQVLGPTTTSVTLFGATGEDACVEDGILADEVSTVSGSSDLFEVRAGEVDHLHVDVFPDPARAGQGLGAQITAVDAWENVADWYGALTLEDSVDGLTNVACTPPAGTSLCLGTPTIAGDTITLSARDDLGNVGVSDPYVVLPGTVVDAIEVWVTGTVQAGASATVEVVALDEWGNVMDGQSAGLDAAVPVDELGEADCAFLSFEPTGEATFSCSLFTARTDAVLQAALDEVLGSSATFEVENGPLAAIEVTAVSQVVAGASFPLGLTGRDAWGNPYTRQTDPTVQLSDTTGSLSVTELDLRGDGTASAAVTLTRADTTTIAASQAGVVLGLSEPVTVSAGPTEDLAVTVDSPWAWLGEATEVRVETLDSFGNRTEYAGVATVSSRATASPDAVIALTNGVGTAVFDWSEPALDEVLDAATDDGLLGESVVFDVVEACGELGPTIDLSFGGAAEAVVCFEPAAGSGVVAGSFVGSTQGSAPLMAYALAVPGGPIAESDTPTVLLAIDHVGVHPLAALVIQEDLCAAEAGAVAYVGPDDGQPVGPLSLVSAVSAIDAVVGTATVEIQDAVDCSRDVAAYGQVKVRSVLGDVLGATATGEGLAITLDANGDGVLTLSALPVLTAGEATLHAWVDSGAAAGLGGLDILQDLQLPTVFSQVPSGIELGLVSEVQVVFSEPMRSSTVVPANFTITGPAAVTVTTATLSLDGTVVTLTLSPPADGAAGIWEVTATDALRDLAGNRLAGAYTNVRAPHVRVFGDVSSAADPASCSPPTPLTGTLRPDGDPGVGEEADQLELTVSASVAPTWWVLTVSELLTERIIRRDYLVPSGTSDTLVWNGRDQAGRVVDNGAYVLEIAPQDSAGNDGLGCALTVNLDNRTGSVP